MNGIKFEMEVDGLQIFNRAFIRLTQRITNFIDLWQFIIEWIQERTKRQYLTRGAAGASGQWKENKKSYDDWKAANYPNSAQGVLTSRTRDSLTGITSDTVHDLKPLEMVYGTSVPYAKHFHVKRPLFSFTEKDKRDLQKVIQGWLVQFTRGLGFDVT